MEKTRNSMNHLTIENNENKKKFVKKNANINKQYELQIIIHYIENKKNYMKHNNDEFKKHNINN